MESHEGLCLRYGLQNQFLSQILRVLHRWRVDALKQKRFVGAFFDVVFAFYSLQYKTITKITTKVKLKLKFDRQLSLSAGPANVSSMMA
jgi:hypothetical protein